MQIPSNDDELPIYPELSDQLLKGYVELACNIETTPERIRSTVKLKDTGHLTEDARS
jgi:hypothetical protein